MKPRPTSNDRYTISKLVKLSFVPIAKSTRINIYTLLFFLSF